MNELQLKSVSKLQRLILDYDAEPDSRVSIEKTADEIIALVREHDSYKEKYLQLSVMYKNAARDIGTDERQRCVDAAKEKLKDLANSYDSRGDMIIVDEAFEVIEEAIKGLDDE